ncbi:hypothetical protein KSP39_PZI001511 [Platanthera zijinensis]|uniref:Uncharacterized protein n=1 Tax=Platanthera zijinensis TaxID=2320716 RepID=A0AAP0GFF7_9ASPA
MRQRRARAPTLPEDLRACRAPNTDITPESQPLQIPSQITPEDTGRSKDLITDKSSGADNSTHPAISDELLKHAQENLHTIKKTTAPTNKGFTRELRVNESATIRSTVDLEYFPAGTLPPRLRKLSIHGIVKEKLSRCLIVVTQRSEKWEAVVVAAAAAEVAMERQRSLLLLRLAVVGKEVAAAADTVAATAVPIGAAAGEYQTVGKTPTPSMDGLT